MNRRFAAAVLLVAVLPCWGSCNPVESPEQQAADKTVEESLRDLRARVKESSEKEKTTVQALTAALRAERSEADIQTVRMRVVNNHSDRSFTVKEPLYGIDIQVTRPDLWWPEYRLTGTVGGERVDLEIQNPSRGYPSLYNIRGEGFDVTFRSFGSSFWYLMGLRQWEGWDGRIDKEESFAYRISETFDCRAGRMQRADCEFKILGDTLDAVLKTDAVEASLEGRVDKARQDPMQAALLGVVAGFLNQEFWFRN